MSVPPITYPRLADRVHAIEPFRAMQVFHEAALLRERGRDVISLAVGEPDFPTPPHVVEAAAAAVRGGATRYTSSLGLHALRAAIAEYYQARHRATVTPEHVAVTVGASGALTIAFGLFVNPGDEVILADPTYPSNRAFVSLFGGVPRLVPVGPAERFQLTPELVERHWTPRTRGVLVASPANPTGTTIPPEALRGIHEVVRRHGGVLVVDEIYHELTYGAHGPPPTAATLGLPADAVATIGRGTVAHDVIVVNSFSKFFAMTGWRIGWIVVPSGWLNDAERLAQHLFLAAPAPSQHAALAALRPESLAIFDERRAEFARRRDFLVPALRGLGFDVPVEPDGAFYVYAGIAAHGDDSVALAHRLLHEAEVAVTPGVDFGLHGGDRHLRFAYTLALPRLEEAVARLRRAL